ncbi:hypothetical protein ACPPVO_47890 [Dactylosporangium sp. McL0621]|uniref:hypothetical protein n=1 Tax=Dactylosporangium sp. McL0621 TaxID=3415678 RepID=UPI003CF31295
MSDVWILRSIGGRDRATGAPLRGVLAAADYHNHAVPLEEEFCGAIGRLVAAGLVAADPAGDRYWLTAAGVPLAERRGSFAAVLADLERVALPAAPPWRLPAGTFRAAVDAYLG